MTKSTEVEVNEVTAPCPVCGKLECRWVAEECPTLPGWGIDFAWPEDSDSPTFTLYGPSEVLEFGMDQEIVHVHAEVVGSSRDGWNALVIVDLDLDGAEELQCHKAHCDLIREAMDLALLGQKDVVKRLEGIEPSKWIVSMVSSRLQGL